MIKKMVVHFCWDLMLLWRLGLGFESTLHSLTEVKGLIVTRLWRWVYKFLRLPIILLYVEMIVGSLSDESQFKTYGWPNSILVL